MLQPWLQGQKTTVYISTSVLKSRLPTPIYFVITPDLVLLMQDNICRAFGTCRIKIKQDQIMNLKAATERASPCEGKILMCMWWQTYFFLFQDIKIPCVRDKLDYLNYLVYIVEVPLLALEKR